MVFVKQDVVVVIQDGQEICVINCHVMLDVRSMDNVKMVLVFVHKDGMEGIALYVSIFFFLFFFKF